MNDRELFCRDNKIDDRIRFCRVAATTFGHEGHEFPSSRGGAFANQIVDPPSSDFGAASG
jgi:hypothetical protein